MNAPSAEEAVVGYLSDVRAFSDGWTSMAELRDSKLLPTGDKGLVLIKSLIKFNRLEARGGWANPTNWAGQFQVRIRQETTP